VGDEDSSGEPSALAVDRVTADQLPGDLREGGVPCGADVAELVAGQTHPEGRAELELEAVAGDRGEHAGREDVTGACRVLDPVLRQGSLREMQAVDGSTGPLEHRHAVRALDDHHRVRALEARQHTGCPGFVLRVAGGAGQRGELARVDEQEVAEREDPLDLRRLLASPGMAGIEADQGAPVDSLYVLEQRQQPPRGLRVEQ